ncbi:MAG: enoyl-CoA hydratase/isomerase family protein [Actinomycetota bacterium]
MTTDQTTGDGPKALYELRDGVAILTLNRPDKLNAWDQGMIDDLTAGLQRALKEGARAVVFFGAGRVFSAGADIDNMKQWWDEGRVPNFIELAEPLEFFDRVEALPIPTIAAMHGVAVGDGIELALACDLRLAAVGTRLGFPEANIGLIPATGGCSRLVKLVGLSQAKAMVLVGDLVEAEAAKAAGLLYDVCPGDQLQGRALELAGKIAAKAPLAQAMARYVLNASANTDLGTGRWLERLGQSVLFKTDDHAEGVRAFLDKRKATFEGR